MKAIITRPTTTGFRSIASSLRGPAPHAREPTGRLPRRAEHEHADFRGGVASKFGQKSSPPGVTTA
jgi:hypothetical protein